MEVQKVSLMGPVRILHTLCRVGSGGVEQCRLLMARHLSPDRFEHCVICQDISGGLPAEFEKLGWQIETIGPPRHILDPAWHRKAIAIARAFKPHIVHGAVYEGEALACSIGLAHPRVPVIMEETSDPVNRRWTGNVLMRAMLARAKVAVAVSPAVGDYLTGRLRLPSAKVRIIDNAVAEPPAPSLTQVELLRRGLGIRPGELVIGTTGRVHDSHKRISDLLQALTIIRQDFPNTRLLVVGDGPDRAGLEELARQLGVEQACIWAGYQSSPADYYHVMDVFVLASAHEAFGLVLVEAMFARRPVVGTRVGGIPYVLDDGKAGLLVPPLNPEALAQTILTLLTDHDQRSRLGELGYRRATDRFTARRYLDDIERLYVSLITP
jgi:glycosyltransferase involved in cell wall biosynthesis